VSSSRLAGGVGVIGALSMAAPVRKSLPISLTTSANFSVVTGIACELAGGVPSLSGASFPTGLTRIASSPDTAPLIGRGNRMERPARPSASTETEARSSAVVLLSMRRSPTETCRTNGGGGLSSRGVSVIWTGTERPSSGQRGFFSLGGSGAAGVPESSRNSGSGPTENEADPASCGLDSVSAAKRSRKPDSGLSTAGFEDVAFGSCASIEASTEAASGRAVTRELNADDGPNGRSLFSTDPEGRSDGNMSRVSAAPKSWRPDHRNPDTYTVNSVAHCVHWPWSHGPSHRHRR
jgi:hypothetical protein